MMSFFLLLLLLILASAALLFVLGARGPTLTLSLAALLFGGAAYALTGSPTLPASPVDADGPGEAPLSLKGAREAFFGRFNRTEHWAILAEGYASRGKTREAAGIYRSATRENPRNYALWALYGNALTDHAGTLSPAAELAYDRAIDLSPQAPGPRFFKALAQIRSGDVEKGRAAMIDLLERSPESAEWRPLVAGAVALSAPEAPAQAGS